MKDKILVIIPTYNEGKVIEKTLKSVLNYTKPDNVLVIDDGSSDNTYDIVKRYNVNIVKHKKNCGLGCTLRTGFRWVLKHNWEWVLTFDADGQHKIEWLDKMIPYMDDYDFIYGIRYDDKMPKIRKFGEYLADTFTFFILLLLRKPRFVKDTQSGFRLINRRVLEKIIPNLCIDGYGISSEIIIEVIRNNFKIKGVQIESIYDEYTEKKGLNTRNAWTIVWEIIKKYIFHNC